MRESLEFDPASNEIGFINLSIFYLFTFKFYISSIKFNNLSVKFNNFIRRIGVTMPIFTPDRLYFSI